MSILSKKKSAIERAQNIKELGDKYANMTVEEVNTIILKNALNENCIEGSNFTGDIAGDCLKLFGDLNTEEMRQNHAINMHLKRLEAMKKAAEIYDPEYVKVHMDLMVMNSDLKKIEDQNKINAAITCNKLEDIKADGRTSRVRKKAQTLAGFAKGFSDVCEDDIIYADNVVKLAQKETAISKAGYARKLWESVVATLTNNTRKELAAVEQKDKLTELIVQEVLQQSENSK